MPIKSDIAVTSAAYAAVLKQITAVGKAFSDNRYSGKMEVSTDGTTWLEPDTYDAWGDSEAKGTYAVALTAGNYRIRVTNGDNEVSDVLLNAFTIAGAAGGLPERTFSRIRKATYDAFISETPDALLAAAAGTINAFTQGQRINLQIRAGIVEHYIVSKIFASDTTIAVTNLFFLNY